MSPPPPPPLVVEAGKHSKKEVRNSYWSRAPLWLPTVSAFKTQRKYPRIHRRWMSNKSLSPSPSPLHFLPCCKLGVSAPSVTHGSHIRRFRGAWSRGLYHSGSYSTPSTKSVMDVCTMVKAFSFSSVDRGPRFLRCFCRSSWKAMRTYVFPCNYCSFELN